MSARIARGTAASSRRAPARSGSGKRRGKPKKSGLLDSLPISPRTVQKLSTWAGIIVLVVLALATAAAFRLPQLAGTAIGEQIGAAGFTIRHLEVRGLNRVDQSAVNRVVYGQSSRAMPLVDLDGIRGQLMAMPWIREARVSRRLPDTLVVEIEERVPAAVWQHNRRLILIDAEGAQLQAVPGAVPNLPLLVGPGAQHKVAMLTALIETAPRLRPLLRAATWIGDRRWDLMFQTGETLSLPEGDEAAMAALRRFAEMDERRDLLGSNFVRFDMRIEGRMIVRLRNAPDGRVPPAPDPGEPPADLSRTI